MNTNQTLHYLWISLSMVPVNKAWGIYNTYGGFIGFWENFSPAMEKILGKDLFGRLKTHQNIHQLEEKLEELTRQNISFVTFEEGDYPQKLKNIPYPPLSLYGRGNLGCLNEPYNLAVIGTRHPSRYGKDTAFSIAKELAQKGVCVISGFAMGIDGAAHQGALAGRGKTIAVLGNGLDVAYPISNLPLQQKLHEGRGLFLTEYPLGTPPIGYHFPQRNRIISGLSQGILFVEGKIKSGGMVTVRHGLDQGKEVFAIPGDVGKIGTEGPHTILREGARLVTSAKDLIEDMGWEELEKVFPEKKAKLLATSSLNALQTQIFNCLKKEAYSFEELVQLTQTSVDLLAVNLTFMEIEGIIKKSPGNMYHIVNG